MVLASSDTFLNLTSMNVSGSNSYDKGATNKCIGNPSLIILRNITQGCLFNNFALLLMFFCSNCYAQRITITD